MAVLNCFTFSAICCAYGYLKGEFGKHDNRKDAATYVYLVAIVTLGIKFILKFAILDEESVNTISGLSTYVSELRCYVEWASVLVCALALWKITGLNEMHHYRQMISVIIILMFGWFIGSYDITPPETIQSESIKALYLLTARQNGMVMITVIMWALLCILLYNAHRISKASTVRR